MRAVMILGMLALLAGCAANSVREGEELLALQRSAATAYAAQDYAQAAKDYRELAGQLRNDADPQYRLGNTLAKLGQVDEAMAAYHEALLRDPKHAGAWHNLIYLQLQGVGKTVAEMYLHLDRHDPRVQPIAEKAELMLDLFDVPNPAQEP